MHILKSIRLNKYVANSLNKKIPRRLADNVTTWWYGSNNRVQRQALLI